MPHGSKQQVSLEDLWTIVHQDDNLPVLPMDGNEHPDEGMLVYRSFEAAAASSARQDDLYDLETKPTRLSMLFPASESEAAYSPKLVNMRKDVTPEEGFELLVVDLIGRKLYDRLLERGCTRDSLLMAAQAELYALRFDLKRLRDGVADLLSESRHYSEKQRDSA